jgi:hypothetical protein
LRDLWAKLLAAAVDPGRKGSVRRTTIEIVKGLEPLDAQILTSIDLELLPLSRQDLIARFAERYRVLFEEVEESINHLIRVGVFEPGDTFIRFAAAGKLLLRAVSD